MDKKIYVISRNIGKSGEYFLFHFIGYYNGVRITEIKVKGGEFELGEDYVLAIKQIICLDGILFGELVKSKKLFI